MGGPTLNRASGLKGRPAGWAQGLRLVCLLGGLPGALVAGLLGCGSPTQTAGGTTDTGNSLDVLAGLAVGSDSQPAAGVAVRLRRADYLTAPPSGLKRAAGRSLSEGSSYGAPAFASGFSRLDTVTGSDGRFELRDIDSVELRLEIGDSLRGAVIDLDLRDLRAHPEDRLDLAATRLERLTVVRGSLLLRAAASQALVQVYGLERLVSAEVTGGGAGRFAVRLPAGAFRLRLVDPDCSGCVRTVEVALSPQSLPDSVDVGEVDLRDPSEPYAAWTRGTRITVNTSPSGADVGGDVTGFPMLVRLDSASFDFSRARPDGADIRFSKPGGRKPLAYEIERWDAAAGKAEIWVRLDTVKGNSAGQYFQMHWGNIAAASESDGRAVFDTAGGYAGVWHLAEKAGTAGGGFKDASPGGNHGTGGGLSDSSLIEGAVGGGQLFDGKTGEIRVPDHASLDFGSGDFTVAVWARSDGVGGKQQLLCKRTDPGADYEIQMLADGRLEGHVGAEPDYRILTTGNTLSAGRWHHLVLQRRGAELTFFLDAEVTATGNDMARDLDNGGDLWFGRDFADALQERWRGGMDEVRLLRASASRDWIKLSFRSQQPGSRIVSVGKPQ